MLLSLHQYQVTKQVALEQPGPKQELVLPPEHFLLSLSANHFNPIQIQIQIQIQNTNSKYKLYIQITNANYKCKLQMQITNTNYKWKLQVQMNYKS